MSPLKASFSSRPRASDEIEEAAASWLARRSGGFSAEESAAFAAWLAADLRHAEAVAEIERTWRVISSPGAAGQGDIARERAQVRERFQVRRRQRVRRGLLGVAATILLFGFFFRSWPHSETATMAIVVRPDLRHLPDGSTVQLNAKAEITPLFTAEKRLVRLDHGEALFAIAKDAARPFVVLAGEVEVRAVGTAFAVRYDAEQVNVLVTTGVVAVERVAAGQLAPGNDGAEGVAVKPQPIRLVAGQRTAISSKAARAAPAVAEVTREEIDAALAWRKQRIEFTRTPLKNAVDLFDRQNHPPLVVADAVTGAFEISGIFWANDPESFVRLLGSAFGITETRQGQTIQLKKR